MGNSIKHSLMLAEIESSNVIGSWLTDVGPPLPIYRISCDAGSGDLLERNVTRFAPCL